MMRGLSVLVIVFLCAVLLSAMAFADGETGWKKDSEGNWRYMENGEYTTGWIKPGNYWYYLDKDGVMISDGLYQIGSGIYSFETNGTMTTGWKSFTEADESGATVKYWMYFGTNGRMQTGWIKPGNYWYYLDEDGIMISDGLYQIGSGVYSFETNGTMTTGWKSFTEVDESGTAVKYWMYFGTNGRMQTGWVKPGDYWYYLDSYGVMLTGWFNSDPNYLSDGSTGGKWYYLDPSSGKMVTGWKYFTETWEENGETITDSYWAYFDENGAQVIEGWKQVGDYWYYFDEYGRMLSGDLFQFGDFKYYYFLSNGRMATGWQKVPLTYTDGTSENVWLYFQSNGLMKYAGWEQVGSDWYYFEKGLYYRDGLAEINGTAYYYFSSNGKMYTGWKFLNGYWRYFAESGRMVQSGRYTIGEKTYYFKDYIMLANRWVYNNYYGSSGAMLVNTTQTIDGTKYTFDQNGNPSPTHFVPLV